MKLNEYLNANEYKWNNEEKEKVDKLIEYLNNVIDKDLYELAKTNENIEVFKKLRIWFLNFYKDNLISGLNSINISFQSFEKSIIYSLILSITRNSSNVSMLIELFKSTNIIKDLIKYENGMYKLITVNYGEILFETGDIYFKNDKDTLNYIEEQGDKIKDGCHEVSFYLIKKYNSFESVTSICKMGLDKKYYHSFILDSNNYVIDLTGNLVMPKDQYYLLNDVIELNILDYSSYLNEKDDSINYDESNTLYELLRCALYKQYKEENNSLKQ